MMFAVEMWRLDHKQIMRPSPAADALLAFILHSFGRMVRVRSLRIFIGLVLCAASARAAVEWKVIKIGGRDFLGIDNIAKFYGFPDPVYEGRNVRLDNGRNDLRLMIDNREVLVNGVRNWLSFPVFIHEGKVVVSRIDLAKTLEPQLRPNMIPNLGPVQTVVLDPGHGGFDKGAISSYGYEKDYALDVARQLRPLLVAKGLRVIMTRESDVFVPLEVRAHIANETKNSIFVSLHFNATDRDPSATGFEIYSLTPRGAPSTYEDNLTLASVNIQNGTGEDAASIELSSCIYHSILGQLSEFDRGIKRARFAVLRLTKIPAVLVEGGFLTERGESRLIASGEWRSKLADSICAGINNFRILAETKNRPMMLADYRRQKTEFAARGKQPAPEGTPRLQLQVPNPLLDPAFQPPDNPATPAASPDAQTPTPTPVGSAPLEP